MIVVLYGQKCSLLALGFHSLQWVTITCLFLHIEFFPHPQQSSFQIDEL